MSDEPCPKCGSLGAEVLFVGVCCPNKECSWYDEETERRVCNKAADDLASLFDDDDDNERTDPYIWNPWLPFK